MDNQLTNISDAEAALARFEPTVAEMVEKGRAAASAVAFPSKESYAAADEQLAEINRTINAIDEKRKDLTRPLDYVKDQIMSSANAKLNPLRAAKEEIRSAMQGYARAELDHKRREEKRLADEAKKKAEDERIALAAQAEKNGQQKVAEDLISKPVSFVKPKVETAMESARSSAATVWKARLTDPAKFLETVARAGTWMQFVDIREGELNRLANRTKAPSAILGVEFYEDVSIRSGR